MPDPFFNFGAVSLSKMADLDDFFAKKDKKKKSKKFVTANTEVLATKLEETARKEHQAEMKAVSAAMTTGESNFSKDNITEGVSNGTLTHSFLTATYIVFLCYVDETVIRSFFELDMSLG